MSGISEKSTVSEGEGAQKGAQSSEMRRHRILLRGPGLPSVAIHSFVYFIRYPICHNAKDVLIGAFRGQGAAGEPFRSDTAVFAV